MISVATTVGEWLDHGVAQGWISPVYCDTHDAPEMTDEESAAFDEGEDPCIFVVRLKDLE